MAVERVLLAEPRGFCAGVEMAIKALAWMVRSFAPPVYCYHEIVHNRVIVDRFEAQGVVFVDDIADVPPGSPIMLSAHGSAPEVVAAAQARGSYVVDSVCPLVTKVHHEVRTRAGKGYRIVYVGHEGHEEAVGTMAVAPELDQPGRARRRRRRAAAVRRAGRPARPDDAQPPRLGGRRRRRARALPRRVVAGAQRPVLRHDQPSVGADGARRAVRRHRRHRLGELLQHPCPGEARRRGRAAQLVARVNDADEIPDEILGARIVGVTAGASAPDELVEQVVERLAPADGVEVVTVTDEDEYFPPPRKLRELQTGHRVGGDGDARRLDDRSPADGRPRARRQRRADRPRRLLTVIRPAARRRSPRRAARRRRPG